MNTIFLNDDDQTVNLDGFETTVGELKKIVIDGVTYRKELKRIFGGK